MSAAVEVVEAGPRRPQRRGECAGGTRPCTWTTCKYHLLPDVGAKSPGSPAVRLEDLSETCALDCADRGGLSLEEVASVLHLTRERVRQIESAALAKIAASPGAAALGEYLAERPAKLDSAPPRLIRRSQGPRRTRAANGGSKHDSP